MLVLTRNSGETIIIDGRIEVKILGIRGGRVRVGVSAPESLRVDRAEVHWRRTQSPQEPWSWTGRRPAAGRPRGVGRGAG